MSCSRKQTKESNDRARRTPPKHIRQCFYCKEYEDARKMQPLTLPGGQLDVIHWKCLRPYTQEIMAFAREDEKRAPAPAPDVKKKTKRRQKPLKGLFS